MNEQKWTIRESWTQRPRRAVKWSAGPYGEPVVVRVVCPEEYGMVDSDVLRHAIAAHAGVTASDVVFDRRRSDSGRIVPLHAFVSVVLS